VSGSGTPTHVIDVPASQTTYEESGLTPGVSYEYTVTAANVAGPGAESAHSNAVLAAGPASQPTNASVSATDVGQLTVAWGAPSADGGAPITGYNIYRSAAASGPFALATPTLPANATSYVNGGLATGTTEYYIVAAVSGFGEGTGTQPISAGVEGLPTSSTQISAAVGAGGTATLTWTTPASSGGTPIVGFHAQDNTGTHFCNTNGALSCTISGLTIGSPYTFTVEAFNRWGTGLSSAPSSPIIAADVPSAATITALAAGNKRVQVTWTAPASDGGLAVGQYKVTASPGGAFCQTPGTVTTCFVTGLTNGQHYTFTVVATNSLGDGPGGSPSAQVTPRTVPTAARLLKAVYATGHKTTVTWAGPANTGGAAISAYAVRWSTNGKTWSSWTTTHLTRTWTHVGFKKGAHAYVQIAAVNAAGRGAAAQLTLTPTK
jgi:fibronectin type 3 domain-containing protein